MKSRELLLKLRNYVVFTASDIEKITGKSRHYAYLWLQRLKKSDLAYEIEKGRYTVHTDSFLVASRIVWPSYVSGWAALQFHHLTEQLPNVIEVVTTRSRKRRKISFMGVEIEFSRVREPHFFGYEKIDYKRCSIFLADKEKAMLDGMLLKHLSPSEFADILKKNRKSISTARLKKYSKGMSKNFSSKIKKLVNGYD